MYPAARSPACTVDVMTVFTFTLTLMESPSTIGELLITTPSMATRTLGTATLVTLSTLEAPESSAASKSGAPGVPGTRVLIVRLSDPDVAAFAPSEMRARSEYVPSLKGPAENSCIRTRTSSLSSV